jgi:hypothetical protein
LWALQLKDASQILEYGKNYKGYWTGELFVKQATFILPFLAYKVIYWYDMLQLCEKIIPAFEKVHSPGYQALIMVDNSEGHSAYAEDALLVSHMNINPGRKQAWMHDGWYLQNGKKVIQQMNFPQNHPDHPNEPKGVKAVLTNKAFISVFTENARINVNWKQSVVATEASLSCSLTLRSRSLLSKLHISAKIFLGSYEKVSLQ